MDSQPPNTAPRRILLRKWAEAYFGEDAPSDHTLRRMVREQRITPSPTLIGKHYMVPPEATLHEDAPRGAGTLVGRLKRGTR